MSDLLDQLFQSIGDILTMPVVQIALRAIAIYVIVVWLAAAWWAFRDMSRRTRNLIAPFLDAGMVILATPILFPAALLVHLVVRPPETAAEREERRLRTEALAVDQPLECIHCHHLIEQDWLVCPDCGTVQRHRCDRCQQLVELDWRVCAWCASELWRVRVETPTSVEVHEPPAPVAPAGQPILASVAAAGAAIAGSVMASLPLRTETRAMAPAEPVRAATTIAIPPRDVPSRTPAGGGRPGEPLASQRPSQGQPPRQGRPQQGRPAQRARRGHERDRTPGELRLADAGRRAER